MKVLVKTGIVGDDKWVSEQTYYKDYVVPDEGDYVYLPNRWHTKYFVLGRKFYYPPGDVDFDLMIVITLDKKRYGGRP